MYIRNEAIGKLTTKIIDHCKTLDKLSEPSASLLRSYPSYSSEGTQTKLCKPVFFLGDTKSAPLHHDYDLVLTLPFLKQYRYGPDKYWFHCPNIRACYGFRWACYWLFNILTIFCQQSRLAVAFLLLLFFLELGGPVAHDSFGDPS